jgi:hypothetical protein
MVVCLFNSDNYTLGFFFRGFGSGVTDSSAVTTAVANCALSGLCPFVVSGLVVWLNLVKP